MAFGGSSIYKGSDLIHDYSCSKCEENDFNTEAQHFCPECEHYLCDKCVRIHGEYFKKHVVYGRGDIQKWAGFSMDRCDQHGNKLEVHCDDHQELLCSSISHLPELARGFLKSAEFKQLPAAVDKIKSRLDELKNAKMKDKASLNDSYRNILAEIKALRKELNQILDKLEQKTAEQLDSMMKELEKSLKDDIETCSHMNELLKIMMDKFRQIAEKNKETNCYVGHRKFQTKLTEAQNLMHEIQGKPGEALRFTSNISIMPFLRNLHMFGATEIVISLAK
ncbi:TRI33-like protein, partial [Mya arenaria]